MAVLNVVIRLNSWPNETKVLGKDRDEKSDIACSIDKRSQKERWWWGGGGGLKGTQGSKRK